MWDYMQSYHGGMGWGWFGFPMMLLFWGVLIFAVILLVRVWSNDGRRSSSRVDPIDILKERYARGEISVEEYEERKRNLEK